MQQLSPALNAAQFSAHADGVFDRIASRYDLLSDLFSLGIHRYWKRRVAKVIANESWDELLDAASGTGDIVLRVVKGAPSQSRKIGRLVASDVSRPMLAIAERRLSRVSQPVELRVLDAHRMPEIPSNSVDFYSMSLGLKICDRAAVLREAMRVLKPGGRLVVLEASNIKPDWLQRLYLRYMSICIPVVGWLATGGDASAYRYLLQGIQDFPTAERLAQEITALGFQDVAFERLSLGIVAIHVARKPRVPA
jgi:demethylmenaquinone methyltransferase/2-methoxy-6-polyprenyl-1,4-benzoquinol methylase